MTGKYTLVTVERLSAMEKVCEAARGVVVAAEFISLIDRAACRLCDGPDVNGLVQHRDWCQAGRTKRAVAALESLDPTQAKEEG